MAVVVAVVMEMVLEVVVVVLAGCWRWFFVEIVLVEVGWWLQLLALL